MNSHYGEQDANLEEMINYIEKTSLIKEYLHSFRV